MQICLEKFVFREILIKCHLLHAGYALLRNVKPLDQHGIMEYMSLERVYLKILTLTCFGQM